MKERSEEISGILLLLLVITVLVCPASGSDTDLQLIEPSISINPVGDHSVGEIIEISGTTNLPVNTILWISAGPKTFTNYPPNYFDGQVNVLPGQENNRWSVLMNASSFTVDEYSVIVHTLNNTFPSCETTFNMSPRRVITQSITNIQPTPVPNISVSQPIPENSVIIDHPKPTTLAPLPVEVSIGALGIMLILTRRFDRKNYCKENSCDD